jgi:rhodanese-related sulfurtransferase
MHRGMALSLAAVLSLAGMFACKSDNLRTLTVDEVASRIAVKDGKTFVFDDNPQDRYAKGHIPGAKWVSGEPTQADLPSDKGATLIFYCASEL